MNRGFKRAIKHGKLDDDLRDFLNSLGSEQVANLLNECTEASTVHTKEFSISEVRPTFREDSLRIGSKTYNYDDMEFFVEGSDGFTVRAFDSNAKELNDSAYYLYCVGLAELCRRTGANNQHRFVSIIIDTLKDYNIVNLNKDYIFIMNLYKMFEDMVNRHKSFKAFERGEYDDAMIAIANEFKLMTSMRTRHNISGFDTYRNAIFVLWLISVQNRRAFWEIFFKIINYTHNCLAINLPRKAEGTKKEARFIYDESLKYAFEVEGYKKELHGVSMESQFGIGAISYSVGDDKKKNKISDCDDFCMYLVMLVATEMLKNVKDSIVFSLESFKLTNVRMSYNTDYMPYIQKRMKACLGNDSFAKLVQGKTLYLITDDSKSPRLALDNLFVCLDNKTKYELPIGKDSNKKALVNREIYEDFVLTAYARGSYFKLENLIRESRLDTRYICEDVILTSIPNFYTFQKDNIHALVNNLLSETEKEKSVNERKEVKELRVSLKKQKENNQELQRKLHKTKDLSEENEALKEEIKRLEQIKNQYLSERDALQEKLDGFYGNIDDEVIKPIKESVSREKMIEELNSFKFFFIGGRFDLKSRLMDLGWTNIEQVSDLNKFASGTTPKSDFFVEMTSFISHTLYHATKANFGDSAECMHFTGTNIDNLVSSCYDFMQNYFAE